MEPFDRIAKIREKERPSLADTHRLKRMTKVHPNCAALWNALGDAIECQLTGPEFTLKTTTCYQRSIECNPKYTPAHISLAFIYLNYDIEGAGEHFRLALTYGGGDAARIGMAQVFACRGECEKAISLLDECANQDDEMITELRSNITESMEEWED